MVLYSGILFRKFVGNFGIFFSCLHAASLCIQLITSARGAVQDQHPAPKAILPFPYWCKQHSHSFPCICTHSSSASLCAGSNSAFVTQNCLLQPWAVGGADGAICWALPRCCLPAHWCPVDSFCNFPAKWGSQIESLGSTKMPTDGFEAFLWCSHKF